jgi:hypothetical protein
MSGRVTLAMDRDLALPTAWALEKDGFEVTFVSGASGAPGADVAFVQDGDGPPPTRRDTPVVFVTSRPEHVPALREAGSGVLLMPFRQADLVRCARILTHTPSTRRCCG